MSTPSGHLRTRSLRTRVTVIAVAVLAVVLTAVIAIAGTLFTVAAHRDVNNLLADRVTYARQLARTAATPEGFIARIDGRSVRAQLTLSDGTVVGKPLPPSESEARRVIKLRGTRAWARDAEVTFSVDNRLLDGVQSRLLWGMVITGLCALVLTAVLLLVGVRYALAPLDAMTALARSIARGHRGERLSPQRRDTELGRTAVAFDDMLDSLEGAEARERSAQQSVRRFVADAAHELRTPITGVQAIAETLLQQDRDTPVDEREQLCVLLVQETRRAGRLVDDMVDMARIDAGLTLSPSPTDLLSLVADQVARVAVIHPDIAVTVRGDPVPLVADAGRISQVVANLVDNACQAATTGGSVAASVYSTPGWAHLEVADTGPGVAAADRERIFERMVRLDDSRDRRSGGSGLGLAVARGLARSHGGELVLVDAGHNGPGLSGAVFRLDLPLPV
ncbi:sensor histidine kinase [Williamsia phyllosphaerae]|uniref:histidine kinase n=1 Tax=Williamsia phyllosphaerae TaxID=885042 RepID=A0ABQ1U7W3_9NOCA|nr:HAMP domain-containing sensor histidine kinase [Williamsia phyllosphaerae]GGF10097.1 two-component sensor histidine kinase [Williamsia phyllosphaerae]